MENESIAEQAEAIKKQKNGGLIAVSLLLSVIAVVSLAFNAYQFIYREDGEDKDLLIAKYAEKTGVGADELREAIKEETVDDLFAPVEDEETEEPVEEDNEKTEEKECPKSVSVTANYIYFPEYGLKLKKTNKLDRYAWRIVNNGDATTIYITAQPAGLDEMRDYVNLDKYSGGFGAATIRNGNEVEDTDASIAFKDGEVIVSYSGSQAYYGDTGMEEEEAQVRDEILKMLANGFSRI